MECRVFHLPGKSEKLILEDCQAHPVFFSFLSTTGTNSATFLLNLFSFWGTEQKLEGLNLINTEGVKGQPLCF